MTLRSIPQWPSQERSLEINKKQREEKRIKDITQKKESPKELSYTEKYGK